MEEATYETTKASQEKLYNEKIREQSKANFERIKRHKVSTAKKIEEESDDFHTKEKELAGKTALVGQLTELVNSTKDSQVQAVIDLYQKYNGQKITAEKEEETL